MKASSTHVIPIPVDHPRILQEDYPDLVAKTQAVVPGYAQLPASVVDGDTLLFRDKLPLNPTQRLVVLVPPGEVDEIALARHVWQLATCSCLRVLYLALSPDVAQAAYQRRRLAGLAALTSDQNIHAHASVFAEKNWQQALEQIWQPGDLVVCLANHQVSNHLIWRRNLGDQLFETLGMPVYLLGGCEISPVPLDWQGIKGLFSIMTSLSLVVVFFGVQVIIERSINRPLATILLSLSVLVEIYLLYKNNEWIG